jgi:hypothetical protein
VFLAVVSLGPDVVDLLEDDREQEWHDVDLLGDVVL